MITVELNQITDEFVYIKPCIAALQTLVKFIAFEFRPVLLYVN